MKIMIIGAGGFLGSALVPLLSEVYSVSSPPRADLDLLDYSKVKSRLLNEDPDIIVNLGALVGGIEFNRLNQRRLFEQNLKMNMNLIDVLTDINFSGLLVNTLPSCFYPANLSCDIPEEALFNGPFEKTNLGYALAKATVACRLNLLRDEGVLRSVGLVLSNLYGPKTVDFSHISKGHFIVDLLLKIRRAQLERRPGILLWGSGRPIRDFFFVDDAAAAIVRVIQGGSSLNHFLYNVGPGISYEIRFIAERARELFSPRLELEWDLSKPDGMTRKVLSTTRYRKEFGDPHVTSLDIGLERTFESMRSLC